MTLYSFIRTIILKPFFIIMFRFVVFGRENLPKQSAFILASNHVSFLDPLILGVAAPVALHYMAKEDLFCNRFIGNFLRRVNAFPVKRDFHDPGAIKEAARRLRAGEPVVVFPEGTRSPDGTLLKPKFGAGFLAYLAGVPVVPVFIKGSQNALPRHAKIIRPRKVAVYFGNPIYLKTIAAGSDKKEIYQRVTEKTMEQIELLAKLNR